MKHHYFRDFCRIGCVAAGGGPLIVAIIYAILHACGVVDTLTVSEVVLGILTSLVLAFISGGSSVIYRIEKLPLLWATLLHALVLYLDYLVIYLVNGWIERELSTVLIFTAIFIGGYAVVWCCVSASIRQSVKKMNEKLKAQ